MQLFLLCVFLLFDVIICFFVTWEDLSILPNSEQGLHCAKCCTNTKENHGSYPESSGLQDSNEELSNKGQSTRSSCCTRVKDFGRCHSTDGLNVILEENNVKVTVDFNGKLLKVEGAVQGKVQRCLSEKVT